MRMIDAYVNVVFRNYFNFKGRLGRAEFWWFVLADVLVCFLIGAVIGFLHGFVYGWSHAPHSSLPPQAMTTYLPQIMRYEAIYSLATLLPNLGAQVRRFHDIGWTGWLVLIDLIPYVGNLIVLVLLTLPSKPDGEKYGPYSDTHREKPFQRTF